ncbi:salt tolerance down-regulator domain-containing protein [Sarocladium implicatum]|nr:salt tolerance down-regulator domain-containing protein [Sarocladium implicatum]
MPPNNHRPAANPPASPRSTAKYTNKDGSKFITVPKAAGGPAANPSDASPVSPLATPSLSNPSADANIDSDPAPTVNRKKQKRRQKAAAKAAAEQAANGHPAPTPSDSRSQNADPDEAEAVESDIDEDQELRDSRTAPSLNGHQSSTKGKKNKKKKKKGSASANDGSPSVDASFDPHVPQPLMQRGLSFSRDKIWSTSNHEERERIKEFWLGLGEDERKSLVKVEKDAVLKKMKEQQKHTCSCTVCGRKRTAIEEELEGLYDAYYLELEQFASQGEGPPMLAPPPRDYPTRPSRGLPAPSAPHPPGHRRIVEHVDLEADEDDLPEEDLPPSKYDYQDIEVDVDDFSDDEPPDGYDDSHERDVADFLTFGNSLQVKGTQLLDSLLNKYGNMDLGGILTVADDLLKNDGKRFIEMMEQLAERRMAREEDAREHVSRGGYGHPNGSYSSPHDQPPPDDEDYEDEEDEEEDYEDSEDEEYEDEEEDQMTEEQRMEEGRRMFQIFAARMFEQRVLSAYKEKVAKERQQKLLEELEEESRQVDEQKAKKAKNAQKKKDKAAQKKQALAEEKARKEAEKAAEEAARLEAEQRRINDQKQKAEEKRKAREAQKRAEEEARLKKEADRQRKLHEQREKQAEQERKAREAKEHEKKLKEEQRLRDKETREQKDREAQERKEKQERDKREKEARAAKAQREAQEAREAKEKAREEKAAAQRPQAPPQAPSSQPAQPPTQPAKRGSAPTIPVPTVLPQHPPNPANYASPKIAVATPALPKGPPPMRPRNASQQQDSSQSASQSTSSQNPSPHPMTPNRSSPGPIGAQRKSSVGTPGSSQIPQTNSPLDGHPTPFHLPPMNVGPPGPPPGLHHMPPGFPGRMSQDPNFAPPFRPGPNMMMPPLGMNGPRPGGFPPMSVQPPPGFAPPASSDSFAMGGPPMPSHQRQGSAGHDGAPPGTAAQPIGRPAPIRRPGSVSHGRSGDDKDDETKHLGSSALVDDEDDTLELNPGSFRNNQPPGPRGFGASPYLESAFPIAGHSNPWGPPGPGASPFGPASFGAPAPWGSAAPGVPAGFHVGSPVGGMSGFRPAAQPRHVAVRLMLCQACRELGTTPSADADGFISVSAIKSQVENISGGDTSITEQDLLDLCDTEGSPSNGGGTFDVRRDETSSADKIRFMPDHHPSLGSLNGIGGAGGPPGQSFRPVGGPGEIGSPLMSQASIRGGV